MNATVSIIEEGARLYLSGNTFPLKNAIKAAGGHWDADRKMWWVGKAKRADIEAAITGTPVADTTRDEGPYGGEVRGKVTYTGKSGKPGTYYVRWAGPTSRGIESVRLTNLAGTIDFWADATAVQWIKRYEAREERGFYGRSIGRSSYPTLRSIRRFIEDKRATEKDGIARTRDDHAAVIEALEDADDFEGARRYAQEHGIPY